MSICTQKSESSPQKPKVLRRCFATTIVGLSNLAMLRTGYCKTSASKKEGGTDEWIQMRSQRIRVNDHAVSLLVGKHRDDFERISTKLAIFGSPVSGKPSHVVADRGRRNRFLQPPQKHRRQCWSKPAQQDTGYFSCRIIQAHKYNTMYDQDLPNRYSREILLVCL